MKNPCYLILALALLAGCSNKGSAPGGEATQVFDSETYFGNEASLLSRTGKNELKTAARNGASEQKLFTAPDWRGELAMFIQSSINKPAWKGKYRFTNRENTKTWQATDPDLRTRLLSVSYGPGAKVKSVFILNASENVLYRSTERMLYIPGAWYTIRKTQKIALLGENDYFIKGLVKN